MHVQDQILTQLGAALVEGSLTDASLLAQTEAEPVLPILPDANVVKIGGQSFIDRGRAAVFPLIEELARGGRDGGWGGRVGQERQPCEKKHKVLYMGGRINMRRTATSQ